MVDYMKHRSQWKKNLGVLVIVVISELNSVLESSRLDTLHEM